MTEPLSLTLILVGIVVVVALLFDFVNGFHDAANAIATIVVTRTLTPFQAVLMAGAANFIGYFFFGTAVAKMIGHGVVHIESVTLTLLLATLIGAIAWDIIAWYFGGGVWRPQRGSELSKAMGLEAANV